jgi:hypothetical protein
MSVFNFSPYTKKDGEPTASLLVEWLNRQFRSIGSALGTPPGVAVMDTTLRASQSIGPNQLAVFYGTLTIPAGITLTISGNGQLILLNPPYGT